MLTITLETDNAAFEDQCPAEVARILHDLAARIENGLGSGQERGALLDINGNRVGSWDWSVVLANT
jgi:hypothetical protein